MQIALYLVPNSFKMKHAGILLPVVGMVAVTAGVWVKLYIDRFSEMARRKIKPQDLAMSTDKLINLKAANNLKNLFEIPVLFYSLCGLIASSGLSDHAFVYGAWGFVAIRAAHSLIQCTYNGVMHRFTAYAGGLTRGVLF